MAHHRAHAVPPPSAPHTATTSRPHRSVLDAAFSIGRPSVNHAELGTPRSPKS